MLLITCPVTGTDELVADRRIRSVTNHPTHIALTVECPCGQVHVYRTGRRWEAARAESEAARIERGSASAHEDVRAARVPAAA